MYVCICNRVTTSELEQNYAVARARCGTQCGKCVQWLEVAERTRIPCKLNDTKRA